MFVKVMHLLESRRFVHLMVHYFNYHSMCMFCNVYLPLGHVKHLKYKKTLCVVL